MEEYSQAGFGSCCALSSIPVVEVRAAPAQKVAAQREGCIEHHYQYPLSVSSQIVSKTVSQAHQLLGYFGKQASGKKKSQESLTEVLYLYV